MTSESGQILIQYPMPPSPKAYDEDEAKRCCVCKKVGETMKCAKCKSVRYCSKECQTLDWATHKETCRRADSVKEQGQVVNGCHSYEASESLWDMGRASDIAGEQGRMEQRLKMNRQLMRRFPDLFAFAFRSAMVYHEMGDRANAGKYARRCLLKIDAQIKKYGRSNFFLRCYHESFSAGHKTFHIDSYLLMLVIPISEICEKLYYDDPDLVREIIQTLITLLGGSLLARLKSPARSFLHFVYGEALDYSKGDNLDLALVQFELACKVLHPYPYVASLVRVSALLTTKAFKSTIPSERNELLRRSIDAALASMSALEDPAEYPMYLSTMHRNFMNIISAINCSRRDSCDPFLNESDERQLIDEASGYLSNAVAWYEATEGEKSPHERDDYVASKHFLQVTVPQIIRGEPYEIWLPPSTRVTYINLPSTVTR